MKLRLLCLVLLILADEDVVMANVPSVFRGFSSNDNQIEENSVDKQQPEFPVSDEFTAIRIEYIKNQILKKLRLKEKPTVDIGELPKPVRDYENILPDQDMMVESGYSDDFYGKTTQAIVFPYEGKSLFIRIRQTDIELMKNRSIFP